MKKGKCQTLKDIVNQVAMLIKNEAGEYPAEQEAEFFFRGESCLHGDDLKTGKLGEGFDSCIDRKAEWIKNERMLYQEALRWNVISFLEDKTMIERIARMQHYQLPTRLADMSSNALVATLFACSKGYNDENGGTATPDGFIRVIKVMPYKMKSFTSDIIAAIAHLPLVEAKNVHPEKPNGLDYLRYEVTNERPGFSMDISAYVKKGQKAEREKMEKLLRSEIQHVWAVKPILNTDRIRSQEGAFLVFGCRKNKEPLKPVFSRSNFTKKKRPSYGILQVGVVCIDGKCKQDIKKELRYFGMPEEKLYPDLSNVCSVIKDRALRT